MTQKTKDLLVRIAIAIVSAVAGAFGVTLNI